LNVSLLEIDLSKKINWGHAILALIVGSLFTLMLLLLVPALYASLAGLAVAALTFGAFRHFERMDTTAAASVAERDPQTSRT
jgi:hypothetical protein